MKLVERNNEHSKDWEMASLNDEKINLEDLEATAPVRPSLVPQ